MAASYPVTESCRGRSAPLISNGLVLPVSKADHGPYHQGMPDHIQQSRRGFREIPGASIRVRGQNDLPYNPGRPLRLPRDRKPIRPPQFDFMVLARLLLPIALLAGLGIGVFFLVDLILGDDAPSGSSPSDSAVVSDVASEQGIDAIDASATVDGDPTTDQPNASETDTAVDGSVATEDAAAVPANEVPRAEQIITPADLAGAPVIQERGAARPVPSGIPGRSLADGSAYDPTDAAAVFSSVWAVGTTLEVTRLSGAPLLSDEEAALLVGKTVQLIVVLAGDFPEELQLTPAAYELLAQDIEPIIAVRIEAVGAPPQP